MATAEEYDTRIAEFDTTLAYITAHRNALERERRIVIEGWAECPECPHVTRTPAGMHSHRGHQHPKPLPPRYCEANSPQIRGKVFACGSCDAEPNTIKKLTRHTYGQHKRLPSKLERTPIEPREVAA